MWHLAERNSVVHKLPCKTLEEMRAAYNFKDLQSFLNLYYAGCAVLIEQQVCALCPTSTAAASAFAGRGSLRDELTFPALCIHAFMHAICRLY